MKIIVTKIIEKEVSCCVECPYFGTVGMERLMMCNHPHWKSHSDPYAGAIIRDMFGFPKDCPLLK